MPTTVEQVAQEALLNVGSDVGLLTAANFISQRYRKLASKIRFRHLRKRGVLSMPAQVSAGEATFTTGSDLVTPDADALAAWQGLGEAIKGRFIRASEGGSGTQPWLEVAGLELGGLRLVAPFTSPSVAGGYKLVARYHRLAEDIRWLGLVTIPRLNTRLRPSSETELSYFSAGRYVVGTGYPSYFSLGPPDFDSRPRIEIYPPASTQAEVVNYFYHAEPRRLQPLDYLPAGLSEDVLREGAQLDLLRLEWVRAVKAKDYDGAAHFRNEYNSSKTSWERDSITQAGDVDTITSDDFIAVRDDGEAVVGDWIQSGLEDGLWPSDRL